MIRVFENILSKCVLELRVLDKTNYGSISSGLFFSGELDAGPPVTVGK
ncbi:MAG: Uncharacterised protein [Hyphomonas sp. TMED17]|nr:MAG: Uncharacterised protein [Hyphomonas sp. TMED17]